MVQVKAEQVKAQSTQTLIRMTVIDFGSGISDASLENIFNPLSSDLPADEWNNTSRMSHLGLYMSRQMALQLGGELKVDSMQGCWTKFTFMLSLKKINCSATVSHLCFKFCAEIPTH